MLQVRSQGDSSPSSGGVPERIGKYVIIKEVGQGSTGRVFLSHDPYYGRDVAIKVYNLESEEDEQKASVTRKMFFNEAQMVGRLQHPNIVPIYDAGEEDGKYYVVTEHIHGARTLAAYTKPDNLLRIDDVVEIIYKCSKALYYAHNRGVVHRDIKPNNIMLTNDNDVRIIDFGIAIVSDSDVSRIEGIAGSPSYMSPEQVQSAEITAQSDIYSLGAVMYELLTGFRPFRANNLSKLLHQIVFATPPPLHSLREEISEDLEKVVARSLQKEPEKRFPSASEFAAALTRVYQDLRNQYLQIDRKEQFDLLRKLRFFHDFSHEEIHEVLRASDWRDYQDGQPIIREGEMDDRFYIIVGGEVGVESGRRKIGALGEGECFGETSYVDGARRTASIVASGDVTLMRVSSSLLEQASSSCQLRFNKVFLRTLIHRLQAPHPATT
ncbi:MAG: serine/threonine-protein kinase [Gammaproteobacteria bacterium]|nr:serine/threonine-protein kinase [Gammaproteobacteria bacterium]MDH3506263.1 serine/threonine-protein kinase [Gammaproteobacteria bacterium]